MNWYRVRLNGQNFLLNLHGNLRKCGFYTTKDVEAASDEQAELKAVELIRNNPELKNSSIKNELDFPMIFVEEVKILDTNEEQLVNSGYTFYSEDDGNS